MEIMCRIVSIDYWEQVYMPWPLQCMFSTQTVLYNCLDWDTTDVYWKWVLFNSLDLEPHWNISNTTQGLTKEDYERKAWNSKWYCDMFNISWVTRMTTLFFPIFDWSPLAYNSTKIAKVKRFLLINLCVKIKLYFGSKSQVKIVILTLLCKTENYSVNIHPWRLIFWLYSSLLYVFNQSEEVVNV